MPDQAPPLAALLTLTPAEAQLLTAILHDADGNGYDFAVIECMAESYEAHSATYNRLDATDLITIEETIVVNDMDPCTQVTLHEDILTVVFARPESLYGTLAILSAPRKD